MYVDVLSIVQKRLHSFTSLKSETESTALPYSQFELNNSAIVLGSMIISLVKLVQLIYHGLAEVAQMRR